MRYINSVGDFDRMLVQTSNDPLALTSKVNALVISLSYAMLETLISDSPVQILSEAEKQRRNEALKVLTTNFTHGELNTHLKTLSGLLMNGIRDLDALKQSVPKKFFKNFPLRIELKTWSSEGKPSVLSHLLEFCTTLKKNVLENPALERDALKKWVQVDNDLQPSWFNSSRASALRAIVQSHLSKMEPYDPVSPGFVHAKGRVADIPGRHLARKCRLNTAFRPYVDWVCNNHSEEIVYDFLTMYGPQVDDFTLKHRSNFYDDEGRRLASLLLFVVKDAFSMRSIVCEPAALMYHQKPVQIHLYREFDRIFPGQIELKNQSLNRSRAREGSITDELATIDLSWASDTFSLELAKQIFSGHVLGDLLLTLRSSVVELPDGSSHTMNKYAAMGSALTFPTQCLLFLSICELVADECGGRDLYAKASVYGDDIVCDSRLFDYVLEALEYFGFIPNLTKSFKGPGKVLESCGGWFFEGEDITPCLPKFKPAQIHTYGAGTPLGTSGLVATYNRYKLKGYNRTSSFLLYFLKFIQLRGFPLVFSHYPVVRENELVTFSQNLVCNPSQRDFYRPRKLGKHIKPYLGGFYVRGYRIVYRRDKPTLNEIEAMDRYRYRLYWRRLEPVNLFHSGRLPSRYVHLCDEPSIPIVLHGLHPKDASLKIGDQPISE